MTLERALSASKLKKWERCPEAFRLKYIERKDEVGEESHHLKIGNAVHESIEAVLRAGHPLDDEGLLKDRLKAHYRDMDEREELEETHHRTVLQCLDMAARYLSSRQPTVRGVELPMQYQIDADGVDHGAIGYADMCTESKVVDWKTGKSEGKGLDEALQGSIYMVGYYAYFAEPPEAIEYAYLKEGKTRTIEPTDEIWEQMLEKARAVLNGVERGEYPAKPDDSKCYWCDYEPHCTASPCGAGNIDWEAYP